MVAKLLVRDIDTPVGSPEADALNVPEQVVVNIPTTLVIAVVAVTVCDCGPEVNAPVIVQEIVVVDAVVELAVEVDGLVAATWLTTLLNACVGEIPEVLLVVAVVGGIKGAELLEVLLPPVRPIELLAVAEGTLAAVVGGVLLGGRVTTLKFSDVAEVKLTFVSTPKLPITKVLLFNEFNWE
jgi:hypothetical protein